MFKIVVTSEDRDTGSAFSRKNHLTYKGHGDDYAVVESGLMAKGRVSGVVMQPMRARGWTLVLHTLATAGVGDDASYYGSGRRGLPGVSAAFAARALDPFSVPGSGSSWCCISRWKKVTRCI